MKNEKSGRKQGGLLRSTGIVSLFTMLSRVLGLVRDVVVANVFGAGGGADAFFVAFKIPNFFRRLFAEGAFNQAFVPVLSEYRSQREQVEVRLLISYTMGSLGGVLMVISLMCVVFAPAVTFLFAPGFHDMPEKFDLASDMLRLTFPYLLLISLTAMLGSVLNSYGRFAIPAFTPVLLNLCLIGAALLVSPLMDPPIIALAWGVLAAGVVQLVFQFPFVRQIQLLSVPRWGWSDPGVKRILALMLPAMFGVSVAQINLLLDTVLASFLVDGSVSWLYYSDRLMELPLGVFGIAIATVILPSLSRKHASQSVEAFSQTLDWAVRMVLLIGLPAALALVVLAAPLLVTLFQYGEFSAADVDRASLSLQAYGAGLLGFMLVKVLAPGYFARQDTKTPVKVGIKAMVANMVFNLALIVPLAHVGLALATSLSALLNAFLLWLGLRREGVYQAQPGWWLFVLRLVVSAAVMVAVIVFLNKDLAQWLAWGWQWRSGYLAVMVLAGMAAYFGALLLLGMRMGDLRSRQLE
ncbi:MAG: murein biosynthesis integral membrane protein MurJ [Pseudomonadales bacterium]|jgi:putative peptidoglycan lipid II flippase|uniref:murein biosynthesis integral membrane protein MurJ n=1 Tax=unclassified Ketobacter TaxID=2639109 RepID=UPI000C8C8D7D|nr:MULTISPECIES: murein biosynthesis integral membrane protein MurJ [unclassified Ketobacter]MAQ27035.1 murein biosynthesis integral membrane protein MurJ [Pseudomonadales bacterium]MEC8810427.1 murein biosynthesis integral membrane protein MurJ [Pseudomonadota bacterium]TNC89840.1 MAG: murein biosynthesis integral membrane protein MurJ [Alcanivorax sp.]HBO94045.1 murein biosynthesis integral membrane protein MurJ [Gammaproteobacteria bacterium]MCK5790642.1 murein biosynthesis integral membran|tara:strand:+ start:1105 stop:2673 length:1569 start_codon:yes stop_codon:yes gene_type:complete